MSNLKSEIKKSIFNAYFIIICALGIIISLIYTFDEMRSYFGYRKYVNFNEVLSQNTLSPTISAYTMWLGGSKLEGIKSCSIFFKVVLFLAAIPFAWSYCAERRKAKKNNQSFNDDRNYRVHKYIAVFISSGLIAAIPLLINLLCSLLFIPAVTPDPVYDIYYREFSSSLLGELFYSSPIIYEILYILIFFTFCGLLGCIGYAFSLIIKHEAVAVTSPVLLLFITYYFNDKIHIGYEFFSPISYMNVADVALRNYKTLFIELFIMFAISLFITIIKRSKSEKQVD